MSMLVERYKYSPITRVERDGKRFYQTPQGTMLLPSVTTVLSATKDMTPIADWQERVGAEEAARVLKEASSIGEALHQNLENYLLGKSERHGPLIVKLLTKLIIRKGLSKVSEIWGAEVPLYNPYLYAGTADVIGVHDGEPAILDFKNSRSAKREEWIEDYFCQLVAYALAHNSMFGTNIRKGVVMMGVRDGTYLEFIIDGAKFTKYEDLWFEKLESYYETRITDK